QHGLPFAAHHRFDDAVSLEGRQRCRAMGRLVGGDHLLSGHGVADARRPTRVVGLAWACMSMTREASGAAGQAGATEAETSTTVAREGSLMDRSSSPPL